MKSTPQPINLETEIDRLGIMALSGASMSKVLIVSGRNGVWGFPKTTRCAPNRVKVYDRSAFVKWLTGNDLKNMAFTKVDRRNQGKKIEEIGADCVLLLSQKIGIKQKKFSGLGKTKTVHVKGHDDYPEPRQHCHRGSHSADHRVLVGI